MAASDKSDSDNVVSNPETSVEDELVDETSEGANVDGANVGGADEQEPESDEKEPELNVEVAIDERSTCERHITVTIPREDIERYYEKEYGELMTSAQVPGFRPGHAPRKLIETRFRKDVTDRVKSSLLVDSIERVNQKEELSPISEPDFNIEAVELPDEGSMTFEFDLEVRPEFGLPQWKGLAIERPEQDFSDKDIDQALERGLAEYGQLVPLEEPAESGDYIVTNLTFSHEGTVLSSADEEVIRIKPVLSFRDGRIENFVDLMVGVRAGETREALAQLSPDAPNQALGGKNVAATFEVLEVKRLELPELTPQFLDSIGGFESEADLRDALRDNLQRRLEYAQHQQARQQVTAALTASADWDLPPGLLQRQSHRELQRAVMELRRSGFSDDEIRAYENDLLQNSRESTARALKEHFILERIAEEEQIEDDPEDYDHEIRLIARQSNETVRRVRARLEKSGGMDALRNQIIERKVVELILANAEFTEVPYQSETANAEAISWTAGGGEPESDIPEAKPEHSEKQPEHSEEEQGGQPES